MVIRLGLSASLLGRSGIETGLIFTLNLPGTNQSGYLYAQAQPPIKGLGVVVWWWCGGGVVYLRYNI